MLSDDDAIALAEVRARTLQALEAVVPRGAPVAVIDAPNQRNVGDSLIWVGELAYLESLDLDVRYVADMWTYDADALRRSLPADGVVLLHGGGNFGDLWPGHQNLRERAARELPDYRLVQLPQSIYFRSQERAALANSSLGRHPDFHVLVRDSLSVERMKQQLPDLTFSYCPDMALGWDPSRRRAQPRKSTDVVVLARADLEATSGLALAAEGWADAGRVAITDWAPRGIQAVRWQWWRRISRLYLIYAKLRKRVRLLPAGRVDASFGHVISMIARVNIRGAEDLYRSTSYVVVDRLHAHVLGVLLGVPHTALDNSYGKVSSIFNDYSGVFSTAHYAETPAEALEQVRRHGEPL
jgi:exopolysaccharide biosynthesis predicted pyruvyltransferase EpsI